MSVRKPTTARSIAAEALCQAELHREFAGETLNRYPQLTERQKATDLVFGVIRNRVLIDLVIEKFSSSPINRIPHRILNVIRVAVFELIYCPQTVEYAILNEAVEYAKHVTNAKQAGFVNAVLRQTLRHIVNRQKVLENCHSRKTAPQTQNTGCEFSVELFPDRNVSPAEYLSIVFSLPDWLVKSWLTEYGLKQTEKICFASNRRPGIYLRANSLKTSVESLSDKLKAGGVECEITGEPQMIRLTSPRAITELPGFNEGLFTVQDLTAAQVVRFLNPRPGWSILDLCAAPGTKTTHLAELTGGEAKIIATDIDGKRLEMVKGNVSRLDLGGCVTVIEYHTLDKYLEKQGGFDCVLLDAPCSNTGVLARRPEVRHRITQNDIESLAKVQADLFGKAAEMLKPQGILCYSTCSIQPEEDALLVRRFLEGHTGFKLKTEKLTLPSADVLDRDGGYAAVIADEFSSSGRATFL
jgi:16S rRNA (cytosine967-C5)-methyltransferase